MRNIDKKELTALLSHFFALRAEYMKKRDESVQEENQIILFECCGRVEAFGEVICRLEEVIYRRKSLSVRPQTIQKVYQDIQALYITAHQKGQKLSKEEWDRFRYQGEVQTYDYILSQFRKLVPETKEGNHQGTPKPSSYTYDVDFLIDLALQTHDEAWFYSLVRKKKNPTVYTENSPQP